MTGDIPTRLGDVLILQTEQSFTVYAVGRVARDGQQDFTTGQPDVQYIPLAASAIAVAKGLVAPDGRVYIRNIDAAIWQQI